MTYRYSMAAFEYAFIQTRKNFARMKIGANGPSIYSEETNLRPFQFISPGQVWGAIIAFNFYLLII